MLILVTVLLLCTRLSAVFDSSLPLPVAVHPLHAATKTSPMTRIESPKQRLRRFDSDSLADASSASIKPLFPGYGTHFAYLYVGTPPQRQSVIIDTGSAYTAFPCRGCKSCGMQSTCLD